jgi:multidrug efflux pump subunit AcrA (membrane-fusion protein)
MADREAHARGPVNGQQTIEELQKRYQHLRDKKVQAETHFSNAQTQLDDLKRQAREKYGTDDLSELEQMLAKLRLENEQRRSQYQAELDRIEGDLASVEQSFSVVEST